MTLKDLPIDLLQEASAALERYVRARRRAKLEQERARLEEELQDTHTDLAEIQALATHPLKGVSTGVDWRTEVETHEHA